MNKIKQYAATVALLGATSLGLAACGGETPTPTPLPPTPTTAPPTATTAPLPTNTVASANTGSGGPAMDLLNQSQTAMKGIKSYHFVLKMESNGGVTLQADGDFMTPDSARLNMDMGSLGKTEMLVIGQDTYIKNPAGEGYISASNTGTAGLAESLSPGQFTSFSQGAQNVSKVGDETVDGASTTHIKFSYDLDKMMSQTATATSQATPAVKMGMANADVWIDKSNNYLRQMKFVSSSTAVPGMTTPIAGSETTTTITYSKFNEDVNPPIQKPTNVTTLPGTSDLQTALPGASQIATNLPSASDLATAIPGASELMPALPGGAPAASSTPTP